MDEFLSSLLLYKLEADYLEGFLSPPSGNFREQIAVTAPYKGNRSGKKPVHYGSIRDYLFMEWGFTLATGQEADDCLAIEATERGNCSVICTTDKDLDQVPGWHYNFVKRELYYVTADEGLRSFYLQVLTGDRTDNIIGIRGVGPVKAAGILDGCSTGKAFAERCIRAYQGDWQRVLENCQLLWLRREPNQAFTLPFSLQELVEMEQKYQPKVAA